MAARKNKVTLSDTWRKRIQAGVIMDRLMKHIEGSIEMSPTQVNAAKIVLGKIEPDLNKTNIQHLDENGKPANPSFDVAVKFVGVDADKH